VIVSSGGATISAKATVTERVPDGHVYISSLLQGGAIQRFVGDGELATVTLARGA
jgi:hypothetical protein